MSEPAKKQLVPSKGPSSSSCHPIGLEFRDDGDAKRLREFLEMESLSLPAGEDQGGENEESPQ